MSDHLDEAERFLRHETLGTVRYADAIRALIAEARSVRERLRSSPPPAPTPSPIPMVLTCPSCGARHIDEGEFATKVHHTHSCQGCGLTWRPAVEPTVGVQFLPGFKNESATTPSPVDDGPPEPLPEVLTGIAEKLLRAVWLYRGYDLKARGPYGLLLDAIGLARPDIAAALKACDDWPETDEVYRRFFADEADSVRGGAVTEAPGVGAIARGAGGDTNECPERCGCTGKTWSADSCRTCKGSGRVPSVDDGPPEPLPDKPTGYCACIPPTVTTTPGGAMYCSRCGMGVFKTDPPAIERVEGMQSEVAGLDGVVVKAPERRVAWRCPAHFKGKEVLTIGGAMPCEACGVPCGVAIGGPDFGGGAEWTTDPKPDAVPRDSDGDDEAARFLYDYIRENYATSSPPWEKVVARDTWFALARQVQKARDEGYEQGKAEEYERAEPHRRERDNLLDTKATLQIAAETAERERDEAKSALAEEKRRRGHLLGCNSTTSIAAASCYCAIAGDRKSAETKAEESGGKGASLLENVLGPLDSEDCEPGTTLTAEQLAALSGDDAEESGGEGEPRVPADGELDELVRNRDRYEPETFRALLLSLCGIHGEHAKRSGGGAKGEG